MRWDGQRVDVSDQQTLPGLPGLVRSVRTPEFAGLVFHEVRARSVLNRVPSASPLPFEWTVNPYRGCSHACSYCLAGDTPILMADGRTKPLAELRVGDEIYGTRRLGKYRRYVTTRVLAHWSTVKPAYRITLQDGTALIASGDHRFLTERGWKHVIRRADSAAPQRAYLTTGNKLMGTGAFATPPKGTPDYQSGYLNGLARTDGRRPTGAEALRRAREFLTGTGSALSLPMAWPQSPSDEWCTGLLAGIFDADGSYVRGSVSISNSDMKIITAVRDALRRFGFEHTIEGTAGRRTIRLAGGLREHLRFFHTVDPAITGKRAIAGRAVKSAARLGIVAIEPLGLELPLFDITTGTGDFIANGVISHNCFARNSHTYLDLDSGHDFDTQIVVKVNAPEVLTAQLRAPSWTREHVAMGTNTDPYQRAEGRYALMPGIIRALAESGTPFSILTKGTVLSRDLPLLASVSADVSVGLGVSIALLDRELQRSVEPGTASPQARLELVRKITEAGLPCGVMVAPVLPRLTDSVEQLDDLLAAIADAGATGVTVLALHLRKGAREWFAAWLAREHRELVPVYREIYARGSNASPKYREWLGRTVGPLVRKHGLAPKKGRNTGERADPGWPEGSLPAGAPDVPVRQEQLALL